MIPSTHKYLQLRAGSHPNGNSNYYIPVPSSAPSTNGSQGSVGLAAAPKAFHDEYMQLDDTRDRVYIHNLDDELAEIEASEGQDKLIFLPDIEKRFSKIPHQVLAGGRGSLDDHEGQELVLYNVPKSLTVDEGHDSVRKAIVEARQRARDKAAEEARHDDMVRKYDHSGEVADGQTETAHGYSAGYVQQQDDDPDVMDIG